MDLAALVQAAAEPLSPVAVIRPAGAGCVLEIIDCLPSQPEPWLLRVDHNPGFVHPLFGDPQPCIELGVALMVIDPERPAYLDRVAAHAAASLDQHRFCFGSSVTWDPDTGQVSVYGQVPLFEEPDASRVLRLRSALRESIGLVYLTSFRFWQLALRREAGYEATDPQVNAVFEAMMQLLRA